MSDQVQLIACHGIQRQIIWIFCRESEVIVQQPEGVTLQKYPPTRLLMILVEEVV